MYSILIPNFYFDSLTDWSSIYDILEVYKFLTIQQARIASNFHKYKDVDLKALMLHNLISSMLMNDKKLSEDQTLLLVELVNSEREDKRDLIESFNKLSKQNRSDFVIVESTTQ